MKGYGSRLAPLTGLVFVGFFLSALVGPASSPNSDASAQTVVSFYESHRSNQFAYAFLVGYSVIFALVFGAVLRSYLRAGSASDLLTTLGFAGMIAFGVLAAGEAAVTFAAANVPSSIPPAAEQALNVLSNTLFDPIFIGTVVFLFANGLAIVRTRVLPRWLGWTGIVIAVIALVPAPTWALVPFALLGWVALVSVLMVMRQRQQESAAL